jgi:hypothetical protein
MNPLSELRDCKLCERSFKRERDLKKHIQHTHEVAYELYVLQHVYNGIRPTCVCGCGNETKFDERRYSSRLRGHITTEEKSEKSREFLEFFQTNEGRELASARAAKAKEFYQTIDGLEARELRSKIMKNTWEDEQHPHTIARVNGTRLATKTQEFKNKQVAASMLLWSSEKGEHLRKLARVRGVKRYEDISERERTSKDVRFSQSHIIANTEARLIASMKDAWCDLSYERDLPNGQQGIASARCITCNNVVKRKILDWILERGCRYCGYYISKAQREVADAIIEMGHKISLSDKTLLGHNREVDVLVEDAKLAIEYDGLYWHCELNTKKKPETKRLALENKGYSFFHIFEDEWINKKPIVLSRLRHKLHVTQTKIHARECDIVELSRKEADEFFALNHIDGTTRHSCAFGLMSSNMLVAAISVRDPLHKTEGTLEIARSASKLDHVIVGGLAKLTKRVKTYAMANNYSELMTYVDLRASDGRGYERVGFTRSKITQPRFWWYDLKTRRDRFWCRAESGKTQTEVAIERGVYRIWGCANAVYRMRLV